MVWLGSPSFCDCNRQRGYNSTYTKPYPFCCSSDESRHFVRTGIPITLSMMESISLAWICTRWLAGVAKI